MEDTIASSDSPRSALLAAPALRAELLRALRQRVPESDAEDLVQAALADALVSRTAPEDHLELRKWVFGILRNKVADFHRGGARERPTADAADDRTAPSGPESARELLRWVEKELPEGDGAANTLDWMLREGDGEKLETIAREEKLPAPRVRQRVARLRRHLRERWALALAAAGLLAVVAFLVARRLGLPENVVPIAEEPRGIERARELRRVAFEECSRRDYERCLRDLDDAKKLDAVGDGAESVKDARARIALGLAPSPPPPPRPAPSALHPRSTPTSRSTPPAPPTSTETAPPPPAPTTPVVSQPTSAPVKPHKAAPGKVPAHVTSDFGSSK